MGDKICGQKTDTATQIDDPAALQLLCFRKATNGGGGGEMLINACNLDLTLNFFDATMSFCILCWSEKITNQRAVKLSKYWYDMRARSLFTEKIQCLQN